MSKDDSVIRNCALGYACGSQWDDLKMLEDDSIRYCHKCQREIHDCHTKDNLIKAILLNRSVNVRESILENGDPPAISHRYPRLAGMPAIQYQHQNTQKNTATPGGFDDFDDDIPF